MLPFTKTPTRPLEIADDYVKVDERKNIERKEDKHTLADAPMLMAPRVTARGKVKRKIKRARVPTLPPSLEVSPTYYARLRFMTNASVAGYAVTTSNIAGALGVVTTAANTTHPICSAFKVKRVIIWTPTTSGFAQCEWAWDVSGAGRDKDSMKITSIPTGITLARPIVTTPPSNSIASFWANSIVSGTFALTTLQSGAVLDMEIDFCLSTALGQFAAITTTAAGTVGVLSYLPLDGTTGKILPAGRPFIV